MKRSYLRLVAPFAVAALALTACSGGSGDGGANAPEGESGGGVVVANGSEPQNPLIPTNTNETGGGKIVDLIYAGLVSTMQTAPRRTTSPNRSRLKILRTSRSRLRKARPSLMVLPLPLSRSLTLGIRV